MPEQTTPGGSLWDEILKAIVYAMPKQIFPLIKEVYGKEYPPDTRIIFLETEHSTYLDRPKEPPSSNRMDISLLIADTDYYRIECQMENDQFMVIRMISYDLHYAIEHCTSRDTQTDEIIIRFPHSMVLYPDQNNKLPDSLQCRVIFQDNSEHIYRIPAVRIQSYSLEEIHQKHLDLFIPYLLLRLKPHITSKTHPLTKKELTEFLKSIILILQDDLTNEYLTVREYNDYVNLLIHASEHIFYHYPNYHKETMRMTRPLIYLPSMQLKDLEEKIAEKESVLAEKESALAEKDSALAEKESALAEKESALAQKDSEIARLKKQIADLTRKQVTEDPFKRT